jgi:tripartite-type tricarboxylate transporter receptor subunit TctC
MSRPPFSIVIALGLSAVTFEPALAQSYPTRPLQLVVPFSAGSSIDILARGLAEGLSAELGRPTLVVNREGASGTIAFVAVANSVPDGYTLAFAAQGQLTIQPHLKPDLPYQADAFQPICQVFEDVLAIIVGPNSPIANFNDLLDRARAKPRGLTFGSGGVAIIPHLQVEGLARTSGIEVVHAPYRNIGQMIQDVVGGRLDFGVTSTASISGSDARVLAILGQARSSHFPGAPTVAELGHPVSMPGFGGLYAPSAVPAAVRDRLEQACAKAFVSTAFQRVTASLGVMPIFLPRSEFAARVAEDSREKAEIIKALNIAAE